MNYNKKLKKTCGSCVYYKVEYGRHSEYKNGDWEDTCWDGVCRRYPHREHIENHNNEICGEYKEKK